MHPRQLLALLFLVTVSCASGPVPVIPGASGFGMDTRAGRGGDVIRVTNLDNDGEGSLRAALEAKHPRTIIFEVGGIIDLRGEGLSILNPYVTVAGQTAPGEGITIIKGSLQVGTHDVLIQHIRVRPGDSGRKKRSGWSPDGIAIGNGAGQPGSHHVVVDHCSVTWAVDENLTASGPRHEGPAGTSHQITFSNCIIAEGLDDSSHTKGRHSKGTLIHDHAKDIAVIGNLYANNVDRNPVLKPDASAVVVNNFISNPGRRAIHSYWTPSEYEGHMDSLKPCVLAAVGNVVWPGADTTNLTAVIEISANKGHVYARDNVGIDAKGVRLLEVAGRPQMLRRPAAWPSGLKPLPWPRVTAHVLKNAGAFPARRDPIDRRIVEEARGRRGRIIDSQKEVGGYPNYSLVRRELKIPESPNNDSDGDGYTNLEEWLHGFAAVAEGR